MKLAALAEMADGEKRVAISPEMVRKYLDLGFEVAVETGAGRFAGIPDADFQTAGANVAARPQVVDSADVILTVGAPDAAGLPSGAVLVSGLDPFRSRDRLQACAEAGLEVLAMEFMPRITRAQSMDIRSSQSNLAGYKAVIDAAGVFGAAFPMMMTAAGTVPAARVFVMGVGVAGLQAIATAKRLGAIVSATDVRSQTKEQIASLGAKAIFVEDAEGAGEDAGGYASEMSAEYQRQQAELVSATIARQDIVITTALIPGKPAPRLVSAAQIATMKPGSVIVDMSVSHGGNVEGARADEMVVTDNGVTIMGFANYPSRIPVDASALLARNYHAFLNSVVDKENGRLRLPDDDEIVSAIRVTKGGRIVHPRLQAGDEEPQNQPSAIAVGQRGN